MLTQDQCDPNNPEQAFAWMFAAGVPDPRNATQPGKNYRNQPLIPPQCFGALSKMLWDFGLRWSEGNQTAWIAPGSGPAMNFTTWAVTDVKPAATTQFVAAGSAADVVAGAAAVVADQFPEVAANIAAVTPATHKAALATQAGALLDSLARLRANQERHAAQQADADAGGAAK